ncbi:alpha/beta hydrolase [Streptomyces sp. NPDC026673]|uniref:alpha/beta hydrolase n=1 Tax=Streptomyces sp. NPDC026673 TaxID=3155724 RepID=UPI0033F6FEEF
MTSVRAPGRTSRWRRRCAAGLLGGCLVLTACSPQRPPQSANAVRSAPAVPSLLSVPTVPSVPSVPSPSAAPSPSATSAGPPDLARYQRQRLDWRPCEERASFQCTTVTVPLDYDRPAAGDIRLAAVRLRAGGPRSARIGSLLLNPGGPGVSAIDDLMSFADGFSPALRAAYDLVGIDPRGVGRSTPVDCPTGAPPPGDGTRAGPVADGPEPAFALIATACARHVGRLLPHVGTPDAARDMDLVRGLLGDDRLHFLGYSYGTYLGATYAELFPTRVGRMVLDGAIDPDMDAYRATLGMARGYQIAWESFAADCATRPDCPVGHSVQEAGRTLDTLVRELDRDAARSGDELLTAVTSGLSAPAWDALRVLLHEVRTGGAGTLRRLLGTDEDADSGDQSLTAINCLSSALGPRSTAAQTRAALPEFRRLAPQFGAYYAGFLPMCAHWPARPTQVPHRITARGTPPILVVGTTRDPATPYDQARALARQLSAGRLLTRDGDGHTAYQQGSRCVDTSVDDYLLDGRLPPEDTVCD